MTAWHFHVCPPGSSVPEAPLATNRGDRGLGGYLSRDFFTQLKLQERKSILDTY